MQKNQRVLKSLGLEVSENRAIRHLALEAIFLCFRLICYAKAELEAACTPTMTKVLPMLSATKQKLLIIASEISSHALVIRQGTGKWSLTSIEPSTGV